MNIEARSYLKPETFGGNLHTLKISAENVSKEYAFEMKEVIFVIDVSCSMSNVLPYVQDSLKIFDEMLGENEIGIHLITFSNFATHIANSRHGFIEGIDSLKVDMLTNMGDGLKIAFDVVNREKASWIVVLTDGESNQGSYQTAEEFKDLVNARKQDNTKIVTIGYGRNTDQNVLNSIGEYVCIFKQEDIMKVIGALYNEITTSGIINLNIVPSGTYNTVIGNKNVGVLFNDRAYIYGCIGEVTHITITYTKINETSLEEVKQTIYILTLHPDDIPEEINREFFFSRASILIREFYEAKDRKKEMERILGVLDNENWSNKEAEEKVKEIMNTLVDNDEEFLARYALYSANSLRNQYSHIEDSHLLSSSENAQKKFKNMMRNTPFILHSESN